MAAVNAGLDMIMVPEKYDQFISALTRAVERGDVPMARIDDAVSRILAVKFKLGLFEHPWPARIIWEQWDRLRTAILPAKPCASRWCC